MIWGTSGSWQERIRALRADTHALYLASRDPRTPKIAKVIAVLTVAYALSPIDLIPDFIPVLGLLDDLVLVPLGLALAIQLMPPSLLAEHRAEAARPAALRTTRSLLGATLVIALWILAAIFLARWLIA